MVDSRYYFQVISLVYILLIATAFFTKKTKKSTGSNMFSQLIFSVLLCIIFDTICVYTQKSNADLNYFFSLAFLLAIVKFVLIFTEYITLVVSELKDDIEKAKKYDKIHLISTILYIFWSIILIYIYNYFYSNTREIGNIVVDIYCGISWAACIGYWIVIMTNFLIKQIGDELNPFKIVLILLRVFFKKIAAIALAIVPGTIGLLTQFFIPNLHVIVPSFTYAVIIMYFTIFPTENPDIELAEALEKSKKEADQANRSKTEYLSNVSHEIRTPLNAILGFSNTLLQEDISDQTKEEVEYIIGSSETLLEIVNEILDISKIESNKLEITNVDYSIEKLYRSLVIMTEEKIGSSQLQFIHSFNTNIPPVLSGDYVRLKQILVNIINNAIKYTEHGFVKLKFSYDNITNEECRLIISITDSGLGIDEDSIDKIFMKFNGMEVQKDVKIQGTGLGLSLTKRLIDMMNGKIVVQSKKGEGSTFILYITQKISDKKLSDLEEKTISNNDMFIGKGERILIVDDNPMNIKVALRLMQDYNLKIETLNSGKEAIAKIQAGRVYDLVMLDDMMPEMSGVEVLKVLKQNPNYKMKTIALTANAMSGMRDKYINDGFDDYLAKPIEKRSLNALLIKYLGNNTSKIKVAEKQIQVEQKPVKVEQKPVEVKPEVTNTKLNKDYLTSNGIDLNKSLEYLGDMEMYNDTVKDFLNEVEEKISNLSKYKEAKDMANYAVFAHSLKSDAKYLGIMDLADIAYKHEMAGKSNDINFVDSNYEKLISLTRAKIEIMKNYID